ncbi:MAG: hypothetical protein ACOX8X_05975 [Methanomethylophilus sp.]
MIIDENGLLTGLLAELGISLILIFLMPHNIQTFLVWVAFSVVLLGIAAVSWRRYWRRRP